MLRVLLYVSHSLVRWNMYMLGRLVYAEGILVLGETVTTTNDRRQRWTRLHSLSLSSFVLYNTTRESFQRQSGVLFTSPNCVRPVTPQSIDQYAAELCLHNPTRRFSMQQLTAVSVSIVCCKN